jgi:hypothetical protein
MARLRVIIKSSPGAEVHLSKSADEAGVIQADYKVLEHMESPYLLEANFGYD